VRIDIFDTQHATTQAVQKLSGRRGLHLELPQLHGYSAKTPYVSAFFLEPNRMLAQFSE
jgi:hypothetical protein